MTNENIKRFGQHMNTVQNDPNVVFGNNPYLFNTREGDAPGLEFQRHDDEPIIMGEATVESSSDSGSDGEETEEDKKNYR